MLQELIRNTVEKRGLTFKQISQATGVSSSAISNFINNRSEIGFYTILKIVRNLFPDKETEIMSELCEEQRKPENIRLAMEYASIQNMTELLGRLVLSQLLSKNATNREWAKVYELDYKWKKGEVQSYDLLEYTKELRIKTPEMVFMRQYFDFYSYYFQKEIGLLFYIAENMNEVFKEITDPFLSKSFLTRLNVGLATKSLFIGNVMEAKFFAQQVIEDQISEEKVGKMYHLLGLSYLYDDGDKALEFLHKAKALFEKMKSDNEYRNLERSILFIASCWGKAVDIKISNFRKEPAYLQEVAFHELKKGNLTVAQDILDSIDESLLDSSEKAFQYYYRGLCTQNTDYFYISLALFNESGNKFYGKLPCIELLKAGEKEIAVTTAYGKPVHIV